MAIIKVKTGGITADAITSTEIADNAVVTAAINADAVTDAKIADDVVGTEHLTANEVDTAALGADAVTGAQLADNAVNSEHYTDGSIDTAHIADAQITAAKLASGVGGKLLQIISTGDVGGLSQVSTNSDNYADVSGVDLVLTPTASGSKFVLFVSYNIDTGGSGHGVGVRLMYNHSGISQTEVDDRYGNSETHITADRGNFWEAQNYYLAPNTTNEITFRAQARASASGETSYFNRATLRIIAMEYA